MADRPRYIRAAARPRHGSKHHPSRGRRGIFQLIDTADCYGPEVGELLLAEALYPYPDGVVVSTKGGRLALGNDSWRADGRPAHLKRACEASLRRLRLETIDLYQLNAVDPDVPLEESLGALVELRQAGKIRNIGVCNVGTQQLSKARAVTPIASVQNRYDLLARSSEPVVDACATNGIPFLAWFPPSNGLQAQRGSALARCAAQHAARPAQIGLAWLLAPLARRRSAPWHCPSRLVRRGSRCIRDHARRRGCSAALGLIMSFAQESCLWRLTARGGRAGPGLGAARKLNGPALQPIVCSGCDMEGRHGRRTPGRDAQYCEFPP